MEQYQTLLKKIIDEGVEKPSGRANMGNTISIFGTQMKFDLQQGFPLVTLKEMYPKNFNSILHELIWFLKGDTNIKYLVDNGVNIWNGDCYRWFKHHNCSLARAALDVHSQEDFIEKVKNEEGFAANFANLGKVYGHQWRNYGNFDYERDEKGAPLESKKMQEINFDQIQYVIDGIRTNPYSRYHIVDAWNPQDKPQMALPPCHLMFMFNVRPDENDINKPKYLDCTMFQRSCDTFLGVPFNIASYAILTEIIARLTGLEAGVFTWMGGDTHLYINHIEQANEVINRDLVHESPILLMDSSKWKEINDVRFEDFTIKGYSSYGKIKAELQTGA